MTPPMLSQLLLQAEAEGADLVTLHALVEEACEAGAQRAMERLGLNDAHALSDIGELRQLLQAWRDAKRSALSAVIGWLTRVFLASLLIGIAVKLGVRDLIAR